MISGRDALSRIEQAIARARADESQLDAQARAASEEAVRLGAERMEAFRDLARLKLDALPSQLPAELDAVERRALAMLAERRQALESLTERRRAAEAEVERAEAERHARAGAFEEALDAYRDKREAVAAEARANPAWTEQKARTEAAAGLAAEAEKKAAQADADRAAKGRPYEADPLFMYLWGRRHGTAEDRSGPLVRFFDRKVARLVGYQAARANYALLNEIPLRLREHAGRLKEEGQAERERLAATEREALAQGGIGPREQAARAAKTALDEAEAGLAEARARLAEFDRAHDSSVLQGDTPYREAIDLLAEADARQDVQVLHREALATPTPRDEAIVRRIAATDRRIADILQAMKRMRGDLQALVRRRAAIEAERDAFRRQGYDAPASRFDNESALSNVLGGILGGLIQGAVLGQILNQGHSRRPGPWDSDFGGGFPFPQGGGDGGGSFGGGGGGFETGGSIGGGGGGFRTGGQF